MVIGRDLELSVLRAAVSELRLVVIAGPAGVGKTALVGHLAADHPSAFVGQALPAFSNRSCQPVLHAMGMHPQAIDPLTMTDMVKGRLTPSSLLVLEDLHWADAGTLDVLVGLRGHCAILVTFQDGVEGSGSAVGLGESLGCDVLHVDPLDRTSTDELIRSIRPDLLEGELDRLVESSGGNPMLAMTLAESDDRSVRSQRALGFVAIRGLLARQPAGSRSTLALLGHAGNPVRADLLDGLDGLLGAGLVRRVGDDQIELVHRMYADPAALGLDVEARRAVCGRLAELKHLAPSRRSEFELRSGDALNALTSALAAAAEPALRAEQAAALFVAARAANELRSSDDQVLDRATYEQLIVRAATALNDTGSHESAADLLSEMTAFGPVTQICAVVEALRAALGLGDRTFAATLVNQTGPLLEGTTGPEAARARSMRSMLASWSGGHGNLRALARKQMISARAGAERSHAALLVGLASYRRDIEGATEWIRMAKDEAARSGALAAELEATRNLVLVQIGLGHHREARALALESATRAMDAGEVAWSIDFRTLEVLSRFYDGADHDDALSWLSFARTAPVRLETRTLATSILAALLADRGVVARSAEVLRPWMAPEVMDGVGPMVQATLLWGAAQRAWIIGDLAETIRVARWATDLVPAGYPSLAGTQVVWRWAEYESGIPITAPDPVGGLLECAALEAGAITLLARGEPDEAAEQFLAAADSWRPILWRCSLRSRWAAGHALTLAADPDRAVAILEEVDAELDRSGCPALRPRVIAAIRAATGRSVAVGPRSARGGPVTGQERAVLALVAEGLTSAQIARRFGISVSTVNSHIRSATSKLGARSRIEAAATLERLSA